MWQRTNDMKKVTLILWSLFLFAGLKGQSATENLVGKVSFVSSQNIYVRFKSCEGISAGDTLFIPEGDTTGPCPGCEQLVVCVLSVQFFI